MFSGAILRDNGLIFCACWLCCAAASETRVLPYTTFGSGRRGCPLCVPAFATIWEPPRLTMDLNLSYTQLYSLFINKAGFGLTLMFSSTRQVSIATCTGIPTDRTIRQVPRFCTSRWSGVGRRPLRAPSPSAVPTPRRRPQFTHMTATHHTPLRTCSSRRQPVIEVHGQCEHVIGANGWLL